MWLHDENCGADARGRCRSGQGPALLELKCNQLATTTSIVNSFSSHTKCIQSFHVFALLNKTGSNLICRQRSAEHWVASIPKGKTEADRLAEEHGLRNAGEVLPDSNVFYFKLPRDTDRRRRKRRAAADIDVLLRHSDVEFLEKQTEELTRVKRVPIPQEDAGRQNYPSLIHFYGISPHIFPFLMLFVAHLTEQFPYLTPSSCLLCCCWWLG